MRWNHSQTINVPRDLRSAHDAITQLMADIANAGFDDNRQFAVRRAVDNTLFHLLDGTGHPSRQPIELTWRRAPGRIRVEVDGAPVYDA